MELLNELSGQKVSYVDLFAYLISEQGKSKTRDEVVAEIEHFIELRDEFLSAKGLGHSYTIDFNKYISRDLTDKRTKELIEFEQKKMAAERIKKEEEEKAAREQQLKEKKEAEEQKRQMTLMQLKDKYIYNDDEIGREAITSVVIPSIDTISMNFLSKFGSNPSPESLIELADYLRFGTGDADSIAKKLGGCTSISELEEMRTKTNEKMMRNLIGRETFEPIVDSITNVGMAYITRTGQWPEKKDIITLTRYIVSEKEGENAEIIAERFGLSMAELTKLRTEARDIIERGIAEREMKEFLKGLGGLGIILLVIFLWATRKSDMRHAGEVRPHDKSSVR